MQILVVDQLMDHYSVRGWFSTLSCYLKTSQVFSVASLYFFDLLGQYVFVLVVLDPVCSSAGLLGYLSLAVNQALLLLYM